MPEQFVDSIFTSEVDANVELYKKLFATTVVDTAPWFSAFEGALYAGITVDSKELSARLELCITQGGGPFWPLLEIYAGLASNLRAHFLRELLTNEVQLVRRILCFFTGRAQLPGFHGMLSLELVGDSILGAHSYSLQTMKSGTDTRSLAESDAPADTTWYREYTIEELYGPVLGLCRALLDFADAEATRYHTCLIQQGKEYAGTQQAPHPFSNALIKNSATLLVCLVQANRDAVSNLLGILDGSATLPGFDGKIALRLDGESICGDLQDAFLAIVELRDSCA